MRAHHLAVVLADAAHGRFPAADGTVDMVGAPPGRCAAVVAFSAHSVVAADLEPDEVRSRLDPADLGASMSPAFLTWLGNRLGSSPGVLDAVFVGMGTGAGADLVPTAGAGHHRVQRAHRMRTDLQVYEADGGGGVVVLGHGVAGRTEIAVEVDAGHRSAGLGRRLVVDALGLVAGGTPVFAQVTPGNVASMRCFLAAGYVPVCAEVLFPL